MSNAYPQLYVQGIRLFNEEAFFECHDVLEELWTETLGEERQFLQGLIQAAVALFHFETGNLGGARKLCDSALAYLQPYGDRYWGIDLERFRADFRYCFQELLQATGGYPAGVVLQRERIPKIDLPTSTE